MHRNIQLFTIYNWSLETLYVDIDSKMKQIFQNIFFFYQTFVFVNDKIYSKNIRAISLDSPV